MFSLVGREATSKTAWCAIVARGPFTYKIGATTCVLSDRCNGHIINNARRAIRQVRKLTLRVLVYEPFLTSSGFSAFHFCDAFLVASGLSARFRFVAAFCASVRTLGIASRRQNLV